MIYPTEFKVVSASGGSNYDFYVNESEDELKTELGGILKEDLCEIVKASNKTVLRIHVNKNSNPSKPDFRKMVREIYKKVEIKTDPHHCYITRKEREEKSGRKALGTETLGEFIDLLN